MWCNKNCHVEEAKRIRRYNGRVFSLRDEPGVPRAWLPHAQSPGMAMSRSFGDLVMKHYGIISTPVITHHHITSNDLFILLATDGVSFSIGLFCSILICLSGIFSAMYDKSRGVQWARPKMGQAENGLYNN